MRHRQNSTLATWISTEQGTISTCTEYSCVQLHRSQKIRPILDLNGKGARFEIYADSKGLIIEEVKKTNHQRRRALLLHHAGEDVFDIFQESLDDVGNADDYDKAIAALNKHFVPISNSAHARHVLKNTVPKGNETVRQYYIRLKNVDIVGDCGFGAE